MIQRNYSADEKIPVESLLYSYYIRYERLNELNNAMQNPEPIGSGSRVIVIVVDVYDMLKRIYGKNIFSQSKSIITSCIINLAAHLRGYYRSRYGVWAKIYLVYADESCVNHRQFYQNFDSRVDTKTLNFTHIDEAVQSQLELVKILCAYIEDVYFIRRTVDFAVCAFDICWKSLHANENISAYIIYTRNKYAYQTVGMLTPKVHLFRPSKYNGMDISSVIDCSTAILEYFSKVSVDTRAKLQYFNPQLLGLMMTMNGCADKNVMAIMNITKTISVLFGAVNSGRMMNLHCMIAEDAYKALLGIEHFMDPMTFYARFKAIDIVYQHCLYRSMIEYMDQSWNLNLRDPNTMRNINDQYFVDNPLDLNNL